MDAQPNSRYAALESRFDFAVWVASRWHGGRPRYWRFDTEFLAVHGMVPSLAQELSEAIDGVVTLIRKTEDTK